MLRSIKELQGYTLHALDGDIGTVDQFYFDDERWVIRYLVADTGTWLPGRRVLISPIAIGKADWQGQRLGVALTKQQVRDSPDIDTSRPISRQHELDYYQYYGWPIYWGGAELWGMAAYPYLLMPPASSSGAGATAPLGVQDGPKSRPDESHLRSTKEVAGYHIGAVDGEIGHVADFIIDDQSWAIRYFVVDTGTWLPGRQVLVSPHWINRISWDAATVYVDLRREAIEHSPTFDPAAPVNRQYEEQLYDYYGRPVYWH